MMIKIILTIKNPILCIFVYMSVSVEKHVSLYIFWVTQLAIKL